MARDGVAGVLGGRQIEVVAHTPKVSEAPAGTLPAPTLPGGDPQGTWKEFLMEKGVSSPVADSIMRHARLPANIPRCERELFSQVQSILITLQQYSHPPALPFLQNTHVFIGPPGAGKTTVLCGYLARAVLSDRQLASVIAVDLPHSNPAERLGIFCDLLGVKVHRGVRDQVILHDQLFVDVPGFTRGRDFQAHLGKLHQEFPNAAFHLVLNGAYEAGLLLSYAALYSSFPLTDIILTHMDEETRWGKIINLVLGTNFNVSHLQVGQNIPGDLHIAAPDLLLTRIFA